MVIRRRPCKHWPSIPLVLHPPGRPTRSLDPCREKSIPLGSCSRQHPWWRFFPLRAKNWIPYSKDYMGIISHYSEDPLSTNKYNYRNAIKPTGFWNNCSCSRWWHLKHVLFSLAFESCYIFHSLPCCIKCRHFIDGGENWHLTDCVSKYEIPGQIFL